MSFIDFKEQQRLTQEERITKHSKTLPLFKSELEWETYQKFKRKELLKLRVPDYVDEQTGQIVYYSKEESMTIWNFILDNEDYALENIIEGARGTGKSYCCVASELFDFLHLAECNFMFGTKRLVDIENGIIVNIKKLLSDFLLNGILNQEQYNYAIDGIKLKHFEYDGRFIYFVSFAIGSKILNIQALTHPRHILKGAKPYFSTFYIDEPVKEDKQKEDLTDAQMMNSIKTIIGTISPIKRNYVFSFKNMKKFKVIYTMNPWDINSYLIKKVISKIPMVKKFSSTPKEIEQINKNIYELEHGKGVLYYYNKEESLRILVASFRATPSLSKEKEAILLEELNNPFTKERAMVEVLGIPIYNPNDVYSYRNELKNVDRFDTKNSLMQIRELAVIGGFDIGFNDKTALIFWRYYEYWNGEEMCINKQPFWSINFKIQNDFNGNTLLAQDYILKKLEIFIKKYKYSKKIQIMTEPSPQAKQMTQTLNYLIQNNNLLKDSFAFFSIDKWKKIDNEGTWKEIRNREEHWRFIMNNKNTLRMTLPTDEKEYQSIIPLLEELNNCIKCEDKNQRDEKPKVNELDNINASEYAFNAVAW